MARVLVLYSSFDGQAARVAERIGEVLTKAGHQATIRSALVPEVTHDLERHHAVIVGGAIRYGHVARYLESFVGDHATVLGNLPNAFFCVCLSASRAKGQATAAGYVEEFQRRTRWRPSATAIFAGALLYRKYNPFLRLVMRFISGMAGGDTDTSRDYEYTDWQAVERFAAEFAVRLGGNRAPH